MEIKIRNKYSDYGYYMYNVIGETDKAFELQSPTGRFWIPKVALHEVTDSCYDVVDWFFTKMDRNTLYCLRLDHLL